MGWYILTVKEQELEIFSLSLTRSMELLHSTDTSSTTKLEITLISSPMVPSIRVCHTSSTTVRPEEFSTSPESPSVSLSTSWSMEESSQRESVLESSTSESPDLDMLSSREFIRMMPSRSLPRKKERKSSPRDFLSNQSRLTSSTQLRPLPVKMST